MKAIETEYKGILFRSRLEARWAVLFDSLQLEWVYEPECFELSNGEKYTPDFYLPRYNYYIEIKPNLEWAENEYHKRRYLLFTKNLAIFSNNYPCLETVYQSNNLRNGTDFLACVFVPYTKYEPFFWSGSEIGEKESLFKGDFSKHIESVKKFRFYK